MRQKINTLEGIRVLACLSVFLCHFKGAFYPQRVWFIDDSPLKIFIAGNTWVRILFVVSGFVVTYKYFSGKKYDSVSIDIAKRYFRLMPAIFFANIFVYFMMRAGMLQNVYAGTLSGSEDFLSIFNNFEPNILACIKEGLATVIFNGANAYISPFWTITYEFYGCILVLCAVYVFRNNALRYLFYTVVFCFFSSYYNYFVLGMIICEMYTNGEINKLLHRKKFLNFIFFLAGCFIISILQIDDNVKLSRILFAFGIVSLFLSILNSSMCEKILGNCLMTRVGRVSFAVYIVHWPIIESFSSCLYIYLFQRNIDKVLSLTINFILTLFVVGIVAWLFNKYIEKIGVYATKACTDWLQKQERVGE